MGGGKGGGGGAWGSLEGEVGNFGGGWGEKLHLESGGVPPRSAKKKS